MEKKISIKIEKKINSITNLNKIELFPHQKNINNLKSNKYFSNDSASPESMKKALTRYRTNTCNTNFHNDLLLTNTSTTFSSIKLANNSIFKFDKSNLDSSDIKFKTMLQKLSPKQLKISKELSGDGDELDELKISDNKKVLNTEYSKFTNNKKNSSEKNKLDIINMDTTIENIDSIDFDIETEDNKKYHKKFLSDGNMNINFGINSHDINFKDILQLNNLFNELRKDLEINRLDEYENKLIPIKQFMKFYYDDKNKNLFLFFDINSLNRFVKKSNIDSKNSFLLIKEYLIQHLIFCYIIILIGLIKEESEKKTFLSGIQNLNFYFHQNFHVFNFLLSSNITESNENMITDEQFESYKKCLDLIKENETWLNENNYKNCLKVNNKMTKQIIKNLFEQIKIYFNRKPYFDNTIIYKNKTKNKSNEQNKQNRNINISNLKYNTQNNNINIKSYRSNNNTLNQKKNFKYLNNINNNIDFINSDINLLLEYIKSYKNVRFVDIIKELKSSPSINYLIEKTNILCQKKNLNHEIKFNSINKEENKTLFLEPINPKYKYTLVLGLDGTLVHLCQYKSKDLVKIREGARELIQNLSKFYEIIIFTHQDKKYADILINLIDTRRNITKRLYKEHTMKIGKSNIKDLNKLGRDLKKVIIVDNCPDNYSLQPLNGIHIISYRGNDVDDILFQLKDELIKLYKISPDDVRNHLKNIQNNLNKKGNEILEKIKTDKAKKNSMKSQFNYKKKSNFINEKTLEPINENEFE